MKDLLVFESLPPIRVSNERSVLNIMVSEDCKALTSVPLIKPRNTVTAAFVNHPDAVDIRRKEMAVYFSALSNNLVNMETMFARLQTHGLRNYEESLKRIAKGVPIYNVFIE